MKDIIIFGNKTLSGLFQDIYDNTMSKRTTLNRLIQNLIDATEAAEDQRDVLGFAVPIQHYLDTLNQTDEHLVKIATIVQRILSMETRSGDVGIESLLSEADKEQLMKEAIGELKSVNEQMNTKQLIAEVPVPKHES